MYKIRYKRSVAGLTVGSQVQLNGVRLGSVEDIYINKENVEEVIVEISVAGGTPVMSNAEALLSSAGITGQQFIDLKGGTAEGTKIKPGGEIKAGQGLLDKLTDRADEISGRTDEIVAGVEELLRPESRARIERILENTEKLTKNSEELVGELNATLKVTRRLLEDNEQAIGQTIRGAARASTQINGVLLEAKGAIADGRQLLKDADVPALVKGVNETNTVLRGEIEALDMRAVSGTLAQLEVVLGQVSKSVGQNQEQVRAMMFNLRQTTDYLKDVSRSLSDKPSRLIFEDKPEPRRLP